jgi:hypothetical protein
LSRHLNASQKAFVALDMEKLYAEEAKKRQKMGKEKIPDPIKKGQSRDKAAKGIGTNAHYITDAKKIQAKSPEVAEEIKIGKISITDSLKLSNKSA